LGVDAGSQIFHGQEQGPVSGQQQHSEVVEFFEEGLPEWLLLVLRLL
jgi:hypothetical protein